MKKKGILKTFIKTFIDYRKHKADIDKYNKAWDKIRKEQAEKK